ncbi:MAG: 50S ribosomal protein L11 methyltransferase [Bryobacteraceae bacterium]
MAPAPGVPLPCGLPYRIDISGPPPDALDFLVQLGALDVEPVTGGLAAILPDGVAPDLVAAALNVPGVTVSPAVPRDNGSVWLVSPQTVRIGGLLIAPPDACASGNALRLADSRAFGTGRHPTTVLCVEALEEILAHERPAAILDVGTGSGVLALAALLMGVPQATGLDIDAAALAVAAENARLNHVADRLQLIQGGPGAVDGNWPLVVANILAAPLIEMAPVLVRRLGTHARLILSGIPSSLESEVWQAYRHLGMRRTDSRTRAGWTVLIAQSSW